MQLDRYVRWIIRHAWTVMVVVLATTMLLGYQALQLKAQYDPDASFPPHDPFVRLDRKIRQEFGGRNFVILALVPKHGTVWQVPVLQAVWHVTDAVLHLPNIIGKDVVSLSSPNVRRVEVNDWGIKEDYLMREPPAAAAGIARLRAIYAANPLYRGVIVSEDERAALVFADFWDEATPEQIHGDITAIAARFRNDDLDIFFTGQPIITRAELEYVRGMRLAVGWTFAIVMAILFLSFRSFQGMLLPMTTAALSTIWGLGWMHLAGIPLGTWNSGVPILTVAVAASHSAQMLKRYYEELAAGRGNREAVLVATTRIGPVMLAAGGTAALGFASLAVMRIPGMIHFGLGAAFGIASAVILEMTFIPAFRSRLRPGRAAHPGTALGNRALSVLAATIWRRPGQIGLAFAAVVAVAVAGAAQVHSEHSSRDYLPRGTVREHLDTIAQHFPGTTTFTVLLEGQSGMAKDPAVLGAMFRLQRQLEGDPAVARTASVADVIAHVNRVFNPDAKAGIPGDSRLVAQLVFLSQSPAYERFVDRSFRRAVIWVYLRDEGTTAVKRLISLVEDFARTNPTAGKARILAAGGVGPLMLALNERTTTGKMLNMLLVLLTIYAVSCLIFRSPLGGLFVVSPLVVTAIVNLGILGWTGLPLDVITASTLAVGVGIGSDYAIYLLYRLREEHGRTADKAQALQAALYTSGRAIIFVAVAIACGFLPLAASSYPAFRLSGLLTSLTMVISCATALTLMPALVYLTNPAFIFAGADERAPGVISELPA